MALDDSQKLTATFEAAKALVKKGSLTADEETILELFPQEIFDQTDLLVWTHFAEEIKFDTFDFTQGDKDVSGDGEFNLLFYSIKTRSKDAFDIVPPRSNVCWQNSLGIFGFI